MLSAIAVLAGVAHARHHHATSAEWDASHGSRQLAALEPGYGPMGKYGCEVMCEETGEVCDVSGGPDNLIDYNTTCHAICNMADPMFLHMGMCAALECEDTCKAVAVDPVCDQKTGTTYDNACLAGCDNVMNPADGECPPCEGPALGEECTCEGDECTMPAGPESPCCEGRCIEGTCTDLQCVENMGSCNSDNVCCPGQVCDPNSSKCISCPFSEDGRSCSQCNNLNEGVFGICTDVGANQPAQATCGAETCTAICNLVCGLDLDMISGNNCNNQGGGNCQGVFTALGVDFMGGPCCKCTTPCEDLMPMLAQ